MTQGVSAMPRSRPPSAIAAYLLFYFCCISIDIFIHCQYVSPCSHCYHMLMTILIKHPCIAKFLWIFKIKSVRILFQLKFYVMDMGRGACSSVVGWGTMLQAGRSWVRSLMRSLDFSIYLILPAALWPLWSTQPPTELSTRNLPGGKGRPARKVDNPTAICESTVKKMWKPRRFTTHSLHSLLQG
jgi:hypothetical protein